MKDKLIPYIYIYRITAVIKVETDIINIITASLIGRACDTSDNVSRDILN